MEKSNWCQACQTLPLPVGRPTGSRNMDFRPLKIVLKLPKSVTRSEAPTWLPPLQILGVSYVLVQGGEGEGW